MSGELHEMSVAIGRLEEGMRFLAKQVHTNQETSTQEHRLVHDIVVATSESVRVLAADIADMKPLIEDYRDKRLVVAADIAEMKPLTADYREKRAEARGAARLAKVMYGGALAIGSAIGSGAAWLINFILTGPRPHG